MKIQILFSFILLPLFTFSQDSEFPMRVLSDEGGHIELVGGDPAFAMLCLQSEFGKGAEEIYSDSSGFINGNIYIRYFTKRKWGSLTKPEWSKNKCILSFSYHIGAHPDYRNTINQIAYMIIKCKDTNGRDLLAEKSTSRKLIKEFIYKKLFNNYAIVNSTNGINVRKEASLSSPVVYELKDQSKVILKEKTDKAIEIKKGNRTIKGQWIKVFINNKISGYVVSSYLIPWYGIHQKQLINADVSLNDFLDLKFVDYNNCKKTKVHNKYTLDTSYDGAPASSNSNNDNLPDSFYLKINDGKEKLYIQETPTEYPMERWYIGKIPVYNQYVFGFHCFDTGYKLYDMKTGQETEHNLTGIPYISPDGKYVVSFEHQHDPEIYDFQSCILSVNSIDNNFKFNSTLVASFSDWLPDETPNSAFWISDNELILKVYSMSLNFTPSPKFTSFDIPGEKESFKYVKLTIKKHP